MPDPTTTMYHSLRKGAREFVLLGFLYVVAPTINAMTMLDRTQNLKPVIVNIDNSSRKRNRHLGRYYERDVFAHQYMVVSA